MMIGRGAATRDLAPGFAAQVDAVDEATWSELLGQFDDANIYQTWAYGDITAGPTRSSRVVVLKDGVPVAMAQARIASLPIIKAGVAYLRWGPLWQRRGTANDPEILRQVLRSLRNEYACRRGLVVRLLPCLFQDDPAIFAMILEEEGFASVAGESSSDTVVMDVRPSLDDLREGLASHWKRELKLAEKKALTVVEGSGDELFEEFLEIYREMVSRKKFAEGNDINQFRAIQARLPEPMKMTIMLCRSEAGTCAGLISSAIGDTALYLFGATSSVGLKSNGSYLLQWRFISHLQGLGRGAYDLNGVNAEKNPGGYKFKRDLGGKYGRERRFLGRYDAEAGVLSSTVVGCGVSLSRMYRTLKQMVAGSSRAKLRPKEAS